MKVKIKRSELEKMKQYAIRGLPNESGGLITLLKTDDPSSGQVIEIQSVISCRNHEGSPGWFQCDPQDFINNIMSYNKNPQNREQVRGMWHSHISIPAKPSVIDLRVWKMRDYLYPIIGIKRDSTDYEFNVFYLSEEGDITQCEVEIEDE